MAAASSSTVAPSRVSWPSGPKSRAVATREPSSRTRAAVNSVPAAPPAWPAGANVPSSPQKPARTKSMRSRSRCTTIRTATLCTRPADSWGITFFHSTGETS